MVHHIRYKFRTRIALIRVFWPDLAHFGGVWSLFRAWFGPFLEVRSLFWAVFGPFLGVRTLFRAWIGPFLRLRTPKNGPSMARNRLRTLFRAWTGPFLRLRTPTNGPNAARNRLRTLFRTVFGPFFGARSLFQAWFGLFLKRVGGRGWGEPPPGNFEIWTLKLCILGALLYHFKRGRWGSGGHPKEILKILEAFPYHFDRSRD